MPQPLSDAHSARRQLTQLRRRELERSKHEHAEAANTAAAAARRQALLHSQKARQQALEAPPPVALSKSSPHGLMAGSAARVLDALRFKGTEKQQALAKLQATEAELSSLLSPRPSSGRAASQARLELQEAQQQAEELRLATEAVARQGAACGKELTLRGKELQQLRGQHSTVMARLAQLEPVLHEAKQAAIKAEALEAAALEGLAAVSRPMQQDPDPNPNPNPDPDHDPDPDPDQASRQRYREKQRPFPEGSVGAALRALGVSQWDRALGDAASVMLATLHKAAARRKRAQARAAW